MPRKKKSKKQEAPKEKRLHEELIERMTALATSGFGLVAALAWNETIQRIPGSGLLSRFIYALLITTLAVLITYQLSKLSARFQKKD